MLATGETPMERDEVPITIAFFSPRRLENALDTGGTMVEFGHDQWGSDLIGSVIQTQNRIR